MHSSCFFSDVQILADMQYKLLSQYFVARKNLQAKFLIVQGCLSPSSSSALHRHRHALRKRMCVNFFERHYICSQTRHITLQGRVRVNGIMQSQSRRNTRLFCSPDIFVERWRRSSSGLSLPLSFFLAQEHR